MTVMVNVWAVPTQPAAEGVTVIVAVTGLAPVFTAVNAGISPLPPGDRPMLVFVFVQAKAVPLTEPAKTTVVVFEPLHKV